MIMLQGAPGASMVSVACSAIQSFDRLGCLMAPGACGRSVSISIRRVLSTGNKPVISLLFILTGIRYSELFPSDTAAGNPTPPLVLALIPTDGKNNAEGIYTNSI